MFHVFAMWTSQQIMILSSCHAAHAGRSLHDQRNWPLWMSELLQSQRDQILRAKHGQTIFWHGFTMFYLIVFTSGLSKAFSACHPAWFVLKEDAGNTELTAPLHSQVKKEQVCKFMRRSWQSLKCPDYHQVGTSTTLCSVRVTMALERNGRTLCLA